MNTKVFHIHDSIPDAPAGDTAITFILFEDGNSGTIRNNENMTNVKEAKDSLSRNISLLLRAHQKSESEIVRVEMVYGMESEFSQRMYDSMPGDRMTNAEKERVAGMEVDGGIVYPIWN